MHRVQQNAAAARLARGLAAEREAKVDVQVRVCFFVFSSSLSLRALTQLEERNKT